MDYESAIIEMKLEAEEAVIKKVESLIQSKSEFSGLDKSFWSNQIYKMTEQDKTIAKLRAENRALKSVKYQFDIINEFCGGVEDYDGQGVVDWISSFFKTEDDLEKQRKKIEELEEKVAELEKNPTTENALSAMEICVDLEKEKYEEKIKELEEKITELEEENDEKYDWDDAIEIIMNDVPACIENHVIRNALEDGNVVTYETYDEMEDTKDEYDGYLDEILDLYQSKHKKGLHNDNEFKSHYDDLPKAIAELYRLYEDMIIERDYYKSGYESLKESSGEEVAIEMMENIMDKTKSVAEKDIERVKEIHRLQMKINQMISGIQHQYKTRVAILEKCDEWKEKLIDIHNY